MKDHKELKGGIIPLLLSLVVGEAVNKLIDQKLSDKEQSERNWAEYEARQRAKEENKRLNEEAKREHIRRLNEDNEIKRIEMAAASKVYEKERELQQKSAVEDVKRASQRATVQKELEQSKNQLQTAKELQQQQFNLQKKALEANRQIASQEQAAINKAKLEGMKQRAIADVRKQFATPITTRRLPPAVSTALLTRRGRGYDNDLLAFIKDYYKVDLKEAKKLYKKHF